MTMKDHPGRDESPDERLDRLERETCRKSLDGAIRPLRDSVLRDGVLRDGVLRESASGLKPPREPQVPEWAGESTHSQQLYSLLDAVSRRLDLLESKIVRLESEERHRERSRLRSARWIFGATALLAVALLAAAVLTAYVQPLLSVSGP